MTVIWTITALISAWGIWLCDWGFKGTGVDKRSTLLPYVQEEKDNLINIVGNVVGEVDVVERENKNGEVFKVANSSVVSKDDEGNKVYHNCSAYGEKSDIPKDFKQGDFVKLFGPIRTSIDDNGKEHSNIRILSLKLLKVKE